MRLPSILPLVISLVAAARDPSVGSMVGTQSTCAARTRSGAVAFAVVERRGPTDSIATVTVCLVSNPAQLRVAGYHGEVTFGPSARVVHVVRPAGGSRIENTRVPGRVAFAGVALQGVPSGPLLSFTVAGIRASDDAQLRLTMLDVTDIDGRDVVARIHVDSLPRLAAAP